MKLKTIKNKIKKSIVSQLAVNKDPETHYITVEAELDSEDKLNIRVYASVDMEEGLRFDFSCNSESLDFIFDELQIAINRRLKTYKPAKNIEI